MKIWLQFMRIEEYSIDFVFNVLSAFKGRFQSFSCNNSWLSCFTRCGIESRKKEDHEELKIFLQNCWISSRFDQKLGLQRKNMNFYKKFHHENRGPSDSLKDDSTAEIEWFNWATIPRFSPFLLKELNPENLENAWKIKIKSIKFHKIQKFISFFM